MIEHQKNKWTYRNYLTAIVCVVSVVGNVLLYVHYHISQFDFFTMNVDVGRSKHTSLSKTRYATKKIINFNVFIIYIQFSKETTPKLFSCEIYCFGVILNFPKSCSLMLAYMRQASRRWIGCHKYVGKGLRCNWNPPVFVTPLLLGSERNSGLLFTCMYWW